VEVAAHGISRVAADQAILGGNDATDARRAAAPRCCSPTTVPIRTEDLVVAVGERGGVAPDEIPEIAVHSITGVAADQTIGFGDGATDPAAAIGPGRRPAIAVPIATEHHVVAVAQHLDAGRAHCVTRARTDQ